MTFAEEAQGSDGTLFKLPEKPNDRKKGIIRGTNSITHTMTNLEDSFEVEKPVNVNGVAYKVQVKKDKHWINQYIEVRLFIENIDDEFCLGISGFSYSVVDPRQQDKSLVSRRSRFFGICPLCRMGHIDIGWSQVRKVYKDIESRILIVNYTIKYKLVAKSKPEAGTTSKGQSASENKGTHRRTPRGKRI